MINMGKSLGKVLLVEDDEICKFLTIAIIHQACTVEKVSVAGNGKEALELLEKETFNIILLDINMPVMDGFKFLEVLGQFQEREEVVSPAIYMLSSSLDEADRARVQQYPAVKGFFTKPLTEEHVRHIATLAAGEKTKELQ